ncbi:MAG: hypothetical protein MJ217_02615 [Bacilli bacterium]|nr:hypothetical protein [Bacilli bacterium]
MGKSKSDSTPIAIEKTLCEDFKDLCDDEGLTFNEGIVTLMQNAVDE